MKNVFNLLQSIANRITRITNSDRNVIYFPIPNKSFKRFDISVDTERQRQSSDQSKVRLIGLHWAHWSSTRRSGIACGTHTSDRFALGSPSTTSPAITDIADWPPVLLSQPIRAIKYDLRQNIIWDNFRYFSRVLSRITYNTHRNQL